MGGITRLVAHLETSGEPLFVPRAGDVRWDDEAWHVQAYAADAESYALLALMPSATPGQRARILLRLLLESWADLDEPTRATLARVVRVLIHGLPATVITTVLLALRRRRANHKHGTRATVRLLTEHPDIDGLVATHRRVLLACLEHAVGKTTARGAVRALAEGRFADARRPLLRFAGDPVRAAARVRALYDPAATGDVVVADGVAEGARLDLDLGGERPATVTTTNRGDIAATLVHMYRGGPTEQLRDALTRYVDVAAAGVPGYPATLALVLDSSASMRGYGDREWALLSQANALRLVLERACPRLVTVTVGSSDDGSPHGGTDLATGVLDAIGHRPDLVAVVSDGYENVYPGDLARTVASLPRAGVTTPVVFCHSAFGHSDDLTLRRPAPAVPQKAFWHEADFAPLMLWLLAQTGTAETDARLVDALRDRLTALEHQLPERSLP
jgi:hypothetical protein